MVEKKSIKIFVVGAAAVALVIGLSVGITESNKSRSMNASYGMIAEDVSQYDCIEWSTTAQGGKSGKATTQGAKSGKATTPGVKSGKQVASTESAKDEIVRRMIVPGTEDYYQAVQVHGNKRRSLATSELLNFRGAESRKLGKEFETEEVVDTSCGGTGCAGAGIDSGDTIVEVDSGDVGVIESQFPQDTVEAYYEPSSSGDGVGVMKTGSGGSKSGKSMSMGGSKYCADVKPVCESEIMSGGGKAGKSASMLSGSGKSSKSSVTGESVGKSGTPGVGKSGKAGSTTASSPTMACVPTTEVEPTPPVPTPPVPTPVEVVSTPVPTLIITPAPTEIATTETVITPIPTPMPVTPEPVTPEPATPEPTLLITALTTPIPTPFPSSTASVGSTPTVATEATSEPLGSTNLRPPN
ncbi:hypothetical protein ACHAXA_005914 [Cyclostephanos tholiformis]|uniref:Uncharacterized protein n=1 Tax=Cyclostephanos tholiformis TaxID=382380 RepID=A0ABD3SD05_9STRA